MAEAVKVEVEHIVTEVIGVDVRLSEVEAQTLVDILYRIGGHQENSRRKHASAILEALLGAGIPHSGGNDFNEDFGSGLFFASPEESSRMGCGCA